MSNWARYLEHIVRVDAGVEAMMAVYICTQLEDREQLSTWAHSNRLDVETHRHGSLPEPN
jgi:hypothetical protein